jgi:hypothetical protein
MRHRNLVLILLLILFGFSSQNFAQATNSLSPNQLEGLSIDEEEIFVPCPSMDNPYYFTTDNLLGVNTKVAEKTEKLKFNYSISGGRIIGTGANVSWDLKNARIGRYKISVTVRDSKNSYKSFSKEIQIREPSECHPPCSCPNLNAVSPIQKIKAGKTAVFAIKVGGGSQTKITYHWIVSAGKIIKGQGTPKIEVVTKGLSPKTITATVELSGDFCAECYRWASSSVEIY